MKSKLKKKFRNKKTVGNEATVASTLEPPILPQIPRHIIFDSFDVFTFVVHGERVLFHKPSNKNHIFANTFRYLGSKDNLWLCQNIQTGEFHAAPYTRFAQLNLNDKTLAQPELFPD
jgi:hypothetical protein